MRKAKATYLCTDRSAISARNRQVGRVLNIRFQNCEIVEGVRGGNLYRKRLDGIVGRVLVTIQVFELLEAQDQAAVIGSSHMGRRCEIARLVQAERGST
jgi:hypothetical protein